MGLRQCANCGVERETCSARSVFYCAATSCQMVARKRGNTRGRVKPDKWRGYFKRQRKVRKRLRKLGAIVGVN